jgi:hypothetical protein
MKMVDCWPVFFGGLKRSRVTPLRAGLRYAAAPLRRSKILGWKSRPVSERVGGVSIDNELQKHYALLLGIGSPWEVKTVELKLQEKKVEIELGWQWGQSAKCPECGRDCSIHAISSFSCADVTRFLGHYVPISTGRVYGQFQGEIISDI